MTDDNIIPVIAKILEDNDVIRIAAYENITPGYPATSQDSKLTATNPTAIWLRDLDQTEEGYLNSANTGTYDYDILFQVDVISLTSQAEAESLRRKVENLLKSTTSKVYGGETWTVYMYLQSRVATRYDDVLSAWVSPLRMRAIGEYTAL